MQIFLEIIYALVESIVFDALAFIPKNIYRALMTLFFGPSFDKDPKRIHWLSRYTLGVSSALLAVGLLSLFVLLIYKAVVALQT